MGGAFSGGSLCRVVGGVEFMVSSVITGFGAQALHLFYSFDGKFREKYDRIQYSAITAITQGSLTLLASLMILFASRQKLIPYFDVNEEEDASEDEEEEATNGGTKSSVKDPSSLSKRQSYNAATKKVKRRLAIIYRFWLIFSVISIGLLLMVFLFSMNYCIQNEYDIQRYDEITDGGKNEFIIVDGKKKIIPPCYAESDETLDLRGFLSDLYSYCLVNIFALFVFWFVVYYQLKRVTRIDHHHVKEDRQKVLPPKEKPEKENKNGGGDESKAPNSGGGVGEEAGDAP